MTGRRPGAAITALFAFFVAGFAVRNGFALDDVHIIFENARVHTLDSFWKLFSQTYWPPEEGASLYRPLTMVTFAAQWVAGGGSPLAFHLFSAALYAFCCVSFYLLVAEITSVKAGMIAGIVFAVHPVHVEVFANVVGQAEMWVATIMFLSTWYFVRERRAGRFGVRQSAVLALLFLVACLFKENAIILPALLIAAELTLVDGRVSERMKRVAPSMVMMAAVAIGFVVGRTSVIGKFTGAGSNGVLQESAFDVRLWTALQVVLEWARLLLWPAQLSADYSFQRIDVATAFEPVMLLSVAMIVVPFVIAWKLRRTVPALAFGVAWMGLALLIPSNLVVMTGFMLAERALFLASAGLIVAAAGTGLWLWRLVEGSETRVRPMLIAAMALAVVAGTARSAARAPVWRDNDTLFRQTVKDVPMSYRAHWMLAEHLLMRGPSKEGLDEMLNAVVLARPNDAYVLAFAGDRFTEAGKCGIANELYRRARNISPEIPVAFSSDSRLCTRRQQQNPHFLSGATQ